MPKEPPKPVDEGPFEYALSPEGRETLRLFATEIRPSIREHIAQSAPDLRRQYRDERQLPSSWPLSTRRCALSAQGLLSEGHASPAAACHPEETQGQPLTGTCHGTS